MKTVLQKVLSFFHALATFVRLIAARCNYTKMARKESDDKQSDEISVGKENEK